MKHYSYIVIKKKQKKITWQLQQILITRTSVNLQILYNFVEKKSKTHSIP